MRFREKGQKIITKPIPQEFADLIRVAIDAGAIGASPESYVIPMPRGQRREATGTTESSGARSRS